jgi:UPF0271 protein
MGTMDLNADLGEGCPWDALLLKRVSSASISCGAHAGDDSTILATLQLAKDQGVTVGAHPGFPDREGFGRREFLVSCSEVESMVAEQLLHLAELANDVGVPLRFVKPHGALYNQAQRDPEIACSIIEAILAFSSNRLFLFGLPGSELARAAAGSGIRYIAEGFADRGYRLDGSLIPRSELGAILDDPLAIAEQVVRLVKSGQVQTLCLHGDDPHSVELADLVCRTLDREQIQIQGVDS